MNGRQAAVAIAAVFVAAGAGAADADAAAFYAHAAACAAALEIEQLALVARARAGTPGLRPRIEEITRLGFTFVGVAYKRGLRNPEADALLNEARAEQRGWTTEHHAAVLTPCLSEAQSLFDDANSLEQWLLTNRANARVDRYLRASPARAASAASQSATAR